MNRLLSIVLSSLAVIGMGNDAARGESARDVGQADRAPMVVIPRLVAPGQGQADPAQRPWSKAARIGGFLDVDGEAQETLATWVEIAYDPRALWVRFRCEGQSGDSLQAEVTERDGPVWRDDSVEVLISPSDAPKPLYHFIVNSAGVTYDGEGIDPSWNAEWTAHTAADADGWSAILIIPFEGLKPLGPPRPGEAWRMNFSRNRVSDNKKTRSIWSPTIGALQLSRYYGQVEFGDADTPPVRFMKIDPVGVGDNLLRVQAAPAIRCEVTALDGAGAMIRMREGRIPEDGAIAFRVDDDEIRGVELGLFDSSGKRLARTWYPMASPAITATVNELDRQFNEVSSHLDQLSEAARRQARDVLAEVRPSLTDAVSAVNDPARRTADQWARLAPLVAEMKLALDGPAGLARTLNLFPQADFAVGLANPMQKIMIQGSAFEGWFDTRYALNLARNEHEGFQVVVMAFHEALENVRVTVSLPVRSSGGEGMGGDVDVSLVGHVDVNDNTRYKVPHHGWWPDPLLNFQKSCDVRAGDHVAFWIDVATRADTAPGDYRATVTVAADGCDPIELGLDIHVWDFELIDGTHLRNAFTYNEGPVGRFYPDRWDAAMKRKYHDLILDHRLNIDHLYRRTPPDIEVLGYARTRGQNGLNVGSVFRQEPKGQEKRELDHYMAQLKQKGLFPYAYVYGYDEVKPEKFAEMREVFGRVHERWPGLETMTTAIDHSYGRDTGLRSVVDIWVPLTDWYDLDEATKLRAEGKYVWWYICVVPEHPYANWFIEYPAIEARLLMGAMSYKYKVDGFLYYLINLWTGNHRPIASGPYTDWDPGSLVNEKKNYVANGDGSLICPGPDGPLSTIRLENIRDGLEDYEYLSLLAERAAQVRGLPADPARRAWLDRAGELLAVPSTLVRNLIEYSRDPVALYAYRERLAEAILTGDELLRRQEPNN